MKRRPSLILDLACITAVIVAVLLVGVRVASGQRWCNNPNCEMCNRLQAEWEASQRVVVETPKPDQSATPERVVDAMLRIAAPKPGETLVDPGCGDGRFLIAAAREYGCEAVGVEIDQATADKALAAVNESGVKGVKVYVGDSRKCDPQVIDGDVVVLYLYPDLIAELLPRFKAYRVIVSYQHELPRGVKYEVEVAGQTHDVWVLRP